MLFQTLIAVSIVLGCSAFSCRDCVDLDIKSSLLNIPSSGTCKSGETFCQTNDFCYGVKGQISASLIGIDVKSSLLVQTCVKREADSSFFPICKKADLALVNEILKDVQPLKGLLNLQVDGYNCFCNFDKCDSVCEKGHIIFERCVPTLVIIGASVGAFVLLSIFFCCCCCCYRCCCHKNRPIAPINSNPLLLVINDQNRQTYWPASSQRPNYEYLTNDDDAPLIQP